MSNQSPLSGKIGLDVTDFKAGITTINREMKVVESGFRATASTMEDWANSADGLTERMKTLTKQIELQQKKADAIRAEYQRVRKEKGENSKAAQDLQIRLNNENAALGKMQLELRQTAAGLDKFQGSTGKVGGAVQGLRNNLDKLGQQVPVLGTAFNLLTNPISLVVQGMGAFVAVANKSIGELMEYNQQVREMTEVTGLSADETSRIIQVADDFGISMDTTRGALEKMNNNGFAPSIDMLAKIADEYVAATDKAEFAREANKKYGKTFSDLIPLLVQGGDALRDQAAAVDDSLIATKDSLKASKDYYIALDNLNDKFLILRMTLAKSIIPILTDLIDTLSGTYDATKDAEDGVTGLDSAFIKFNSGLWGIREAIRIAHWSLDNFKSAMTGKGYITFSEWIEKTESDARGMAYSMAVDVTDAMKRGGDATATAAGQTEDLDDAIQSLVDQGYSKLEEKTTRAAEQLAILEQAATDSKDAINRLVTDGINKLTDSLGEQIKLQALLDLWQGKITLATYQQITANAGLIGNIEKLNEGIESGLVTENEWLAAMADGVVTQQELEDALDETNTKLKDGKTYLHDYDEGLKGIEGDHQVRINIVTSGQIPTIPRGTFGSSGAVIYEEEEGPGGQHGLDMVVPPGYPDDRFRVRATSGERVIVIPQWEQFGRGSIPGGGRAASQGNGPQMAPVTININGAPEREMDMRRLARFVALEIQRAQL